MPSQWERKLSEMRGRENACRGSRMPVARAIDVDESGHAPYVQRQKFRRAGVIPARFLFERALMKIRNSLKSLKNRHRDCRVIRRRGRTYVINKTNRRFKARQG